MRVIEVLASHTHKYVVEPRIICADPIFPLASALWATHSLFPSSSILLLSPLSAASSSPRSSITGSTTSP
jgi:hypothetical protein